MVPIPEMFPTGLLPPGHHQCTLAEIEERFTFTERRKVLLAGLRSVLDMLPGKEAVEYVLVDGSFVEAKGEPRDVDVLVVFSTKRNPLSAKRLTAWVRKWAEILHQVRCVDLYTSEESWAAEYWSGFFGATRDGRSKGVLVLTEGWN